MSDFLVDSNCGINYFKIYNPENSLTIKPYVDEIEKSRAEDLKSLMRSVNDIRSDLELLKSDVHNLTETQNTNGLKKNLYKIEERISSLKSVINQELLELLRNEISLFKDIHFIEKRIEEWGKPIDHQIFKPVNQSKYRIRQSNVKNPIVEFQKFLSRTGGHYGGWEEQDHLLFLKERAKYKNKNKSVSAVHCLLPDIKIEEIEEHEKWYRNYESLRDAQKEAIQRWRLEKESKQKEKQKEENKEKRETKKIARQRIDIAERIKEWKNQQLMKKLEEEESQRKEKEKLKEEQKKKLELQEVKKLAVTQYKAEKLNKLNQILPEEDKRHLTQETKAKNKILLRAFRLQDMKFTEKKKIIRLRFESKSSDKFGRFRLAKPALENILKRDPQRIFQPTLIWNQHCLESQKRGKIDPVFDLNSIPRLAIPEWRRPLK